MNLRIAIGFSLCMASLMGCPTVEAGTDAGPRTDARVTVDARGAGTDAPGAGTDAPVVARDAPAVGSDAPVVGSDAPGAAVRWSTVHTSLQTSCSPCHAGSSAGGHNMAGVDEMRSYIDSQVASTRCAGLNTGACAARRVRDGSMPPGGLAEPARTNLANLLDRWVAGGQLR